MPSDISKVAALCKGGVFLTINDHRPVYMSVQEHLADSYPDPPDIEAGILQKMIETDSVIELQFYPHTPIGFYTVYHYDVDMAIAEALKILKEECKLQV